MTQCKQICAICLVNDLLFFRKEANKINSLIDFNNVER